VSESEGNSTNNTHNSPKVFAKEAPSNNVTGPTDIRSMIDMAKQKAPKKADRIEELYQRSLHDTELSPLLEAALGANATPGGLNQLQKYVDETKMKSDLSRHTTPQSNVHTETNTIETETGAQAKSRLNEATNIVQITGAGIQDPLTTFCASQLWPRYCRLPPGRNTTLAFEAMTSITVDERGQSAPSHSIPDSWLQEVLTQLSQLLQVARAEQWAWIQKVIATPGYRGQDVHVLLVEEVIWAAHHGPDKNRQKRGEIGLLLECIGIERKGATWKG
jgi:hypothetical protein